MSMVIQFYVCSGQAQARLHFCVVRINAIASAQTFFRLSSVRRVYVFAILFLPMLCVLRRKGE